MERTSGGAFPAYARKTIFERGAGIRTREVLGVASVSGSFVGQRTEVAQARDATESADEGNVRVIAAACSAVHVIDGDGQRRLLEHMLEDRRILERVSGFDVQRLPIRAFTVLRQATLCA
jgi:hypothetical protein